MRMANVLDRELFLDDVTYRVFANGKSGLGSGSQVSDFSVRLPRSFLFLLVRLLAYPFSSKLRTIKPKNPEWRCFFFFKQRRSRTLGRILGFGEIATRCRCWRSVRSHRSTILCVERCYTSRGKQGQGKSLPLLNVLFVLILIFSDSSQSGDCFTPDYSTHQLDTNVCTFTQSVTCSQCRQLLTKIFVRLLNKC
ncbi:uncharacterized protein LOC111271486 isoform X2 [Varroa jacobsoni]|uniref:uncharacterized protein LOC111271486 isoform X2 n=1 Tax=Varroa jacobsoni TaxID=62625 RepID=UPI000BF7532E|nr:uncharacterized protein LOC111271486 isoform X2 [Varroa jacobsoni]